jgi:formylglycine-generating enzyme required for sulfatase activity
MCTTAPHPVTARRLCALAPPALLAALAALAGCGGGGGGGDLTAAGGTASTGPGSVQVLDVAAGTLGPANLDGATFDARGALAPHALAVREVLASSSVQGAQSGSLGAQGDETRHVASVGVFYLSCFELTQGQWTALATRAGLTGSDLAPWQVVGSPAAAGSPPDAADRAASGLGYDLVQLMIAGYNAAAPAGQPTLRLPTDSEWEHAARAASTARFSWGESEDPTTVGTFAVVRESRVGLGADLVGGSGGTTRQPNAFGFFDMAGNVWEWTQSSGPDATMRGGSWSDNLLSARCANKQTMDRTLAYATAGVRLVVVLP